MKRVLWRSSIVCIITKFSFSIRLPKEIVNPEGPEILSITCLFPWTLARCGPEYVLFLISEREQGCFQWKWGNLADEETALTRRRKTWIVTHPPSLSRWPGCLWDSYERNIRPSYQVSSVTLYRSVVIFLKITGFMQIKSIFWSSRCIDNSFRAVQVVLGFSSPGSWGSGAQTRPQPSQAGRVTLSP